MEKIFLQIVSVFEYPVYFLILAAFLYSVYSLGIFTAQYIRRITGNHNIPDMSTEDLYLKTLRSLEIPRLISRMMPLIGLVGTLIPLGPALTALSQGDTQTVGTNLSYAFGAVSLSLISASLMYYVSTVRRRWLMEDIKLMEAKKDEL